MSLLQKTIDFFKSDSPRDQLGRFKITFGQNEIFNQMIEKHLDHNRYQYAKISILNSDKLRGHGFIVPLTIEEAIFLGSKYSYLNGQKFLIPEIETLELANDKIAFNEFLDLYGFEKHLPNSIDGTEFPCVLKKSVDCGGQNTILIHDTDELKSLEKLVKRDDYFIQPFVTGDTEYTDHIFYDEGILYSCTIRFQMNEDFYVRGVKMQPYKNVQIEIVPSLYSDVFEEILSKLGYTGLCCFNYKIVEDRPIIFELNPRFGGSLPRDINRLVATIENYYCS